MTFEDLNSELPNGFHDARLHGIVIDYVAGSMSLRLDVWVGNLDGPDRETYRAAELRVAGLCFCSIEVPDPRYPYMPDGSPLDVSGDAADSRTLAALEQLSRTLPSGTSCYRFFVQDWNSFIHVAAKEFQVHWIQRQDQSTVETS